MASLFPPDANKRFFCGAAALIFAGVVLLGGIYYANFFLREYEPIQPVEFSHQLHAGELSLSCLACHVSVSRSASAGIPDTRSCMRCHQHILPDSLLIAPLRRAADEQYEAYDGRLVQWIKVNRLSAGARFHHAAHISRGIGCADCHGRTDEQQRTRAPRTARMRQCVDCHQRPEQHLRPLEEVDNARYVAEDYLKQHPVHGADGKRIYTQLELGEHLKRQWNIQPGTSCTTCHY